MVIVITCLCSQTLAAIEITKPGQKDKVEWDTTFEGKITPVPNNTSAENVYVLIWPVHDYVGHEGRWQVYKADLESDGHWDVNIKVGRSPLYFPEDIGMLFKIIAIETNESIEEGAIRELPENVSKSKQIAIVRGGQ